MTEFTEWRCRKCLTWNPNNKDDPYDAVCACGYDNTGMTVSFRGKADD